MFRQSYSGVSFAVRALFCLGGRVGSGPFGIVPPSHGAGIFAEERVFCRPLSLSDSVPRSACSVNLDPEPRAAEVPYSTSSPAVPAD